MTSFTLKLNLRELELLSSLAGDQLFRREFIDSRIPGYNATLTDLKLGKELIERLRTMTDRAHGFISARSQSQSNKALRD